MPRTVDLMALVDVNSPALGSAWKWQGKALVDDHNSRNSVLFFPYEPPAEYDFALTFERAMGATHNFSIAVIGAGRPFTFLMGFNKNTVAGFMSVAGARVSSNRGTRSADHWITPGHVQTLTAKVRRGRTEIWLDGVKVDSIDTDYHEMGPARWNSGHTTLGMCSNDPGDDLILAAEVTEMSGPGKVVRNSEKAVTPQSDSLSAPDADQLEMPAATQPATITPTPQVDPHGG